jgi:hypothetical protein
MRQYLLPPGPPPAPTGMSLDGSEQSLIRRVPLEGGPADKLGGNAKWFRREASLMRHDRSGGRGAISRRSIQLGFFQGLKKMWMPAGVYGKPE